VTRVLASFRRRRRPGRPFLDVTVALVFEPRDLWVGAYWKRENAIVSTCLYVWVCLLPMLPIRLAIVTLRPGVTEEVGREANP
jgi:hypothetical protein